MKFIYTLLAIVAMAAFASCTDTDSQPITTIECEASVAEVTPAWVTFALKVNSDNEDMIRFFQALIVDSNGKEIGNGSASFRFEDGQSTSSTAYATINFDSYNGMKPGNTYTYQIVAYVDLSLDSGAANIILDEGTFTVPTVEEYLADMSVEVTMEISMITNNAAQLTIRFPEEIVFERDYYDADKIIAIVSKSPEFTDPIEVSPDRNYSAHTNIYTLTDLEENTQYFVKLHGDFTLISPSGYEAEMKDYDLKVKPDSFKTLSGEEVISNAKCRLGEDLVLDNSASLYIYLPETWVPYREYTNDPVNCTIIYSTDQQFNDYVSVTNSTYKDNRFTFNINNLTPETTYYVALKGDFECTQVNQVLKDYILPADKSFTTTHANQIEMVDGHAVVDLGLSVKWATENVTNGTEEYFAWPEVSGVKDIAGTEYDIAKKYWGGSWQMPSEEQMRELLENCTVKGDILVGPNKNYIKLPGKGYYGDYSWLDYNGYFYYWTSTESSEYRNRAVALGSYSLSPSFSSYKKTYRMPVRAVTK